MPIQQAIFTSAQTGHSEGYQIVAASSGLSADDTQALKTWCPSHDALLDPSAVAASINFHPLPSGKWCVSRTTAEGAEYSGRGGSRLHTHCLVAPSEVLIRFANNPFALIRAAVAGGKMIADGPIPTQLEPLTLPGRSGPIDPMLLSRLRRQYPAERLGAVLQIALSKKPLGLAVGRDVERLMAGLLNCVPVECRTELWFSTGLKFSPRRPFHWIAVSSDPTQYRHLQRQFGTQVVDLCDDAWEGDEPLDHGWVRLVVTCLRSGGLSALESSLAKPHPGLTLDKLSEIGAQYEAKLCGAVR